MPKIGTPNTGKMSGSKRKDVATPGLQKGIIKKQKIAPNVTTQDLQKGIIKKQKTPYIPPADLETAEDSDPIVESDTTEHSGDDDGVSWPSDEDAENEVSGDDGSDEGVPLPESTSKKDSKSKAPATESTGNQSRSAMGAMMRLLLTPPRLFKGIPRKTKSFGSGTQSREAQCRFHCKNQKALGAPTNKVSRAKRRAKKDGWRALRDHHR